MDAPDPQGILRDLKAAGDVQHLAAFVAVVTARSFTAAAERSGTDKSQLSRRVRSLEDHLGVRLLHRTTRSVRPTEAGQWLYDACAGPLLQLLGALHQVRHSPRLEGQVRIGGSTFLTRAVWTPLVAELASHPGLVVDLRLADAFEDFVAAGFDLALRLGNLPDSSLIARRIATWGYVLVAAPSWVTDHPDATTVPDLLPHWLGYAPHARSSQWRAICGSTVETVTVRPRRSVDSAEALYTMALAGLGPTAMADFMVVDALDAGTLVRVCPDWRLDHSHGLYLVTAHRDYVPGRVQLVIELVCALVAQAETRWAAVHR